MSRANVVQKGSAPVRAWRSISTVVIVAITICAVAGGLVALLLTRENGFSESQIHMERTAVVSSGPSFKVTVKLLETLTVSDDLRITLTEVQQQPDTKKYKVWATVVIKGQPDMQIRRAEEGAAVTYPEEHGYTIELIKATADWAKFSITKNP